MRRFEESQYDEFRQLVKLGNDNVECLRQMRSWCKHVEIERKSEGLYAQMTGLPIASHSIDCPKVEGKMESMNLRWIFSDFLVRHCAACPYHFPNGNPSWGQEIIKNHQEKVQRHEQAAKEEADRISKLRSELCSKSRNISAEAESESYRILVFLEEVFSEDEVKHKEASERLKQSARLGADLFPDSAIDLILLLAGSNEFSGLMLPVYVELASNRPDLSSRLSRTVLENLEKGLHPELSASVLDILGKAVTYPLDEACIKRLLLFQNHCPISKWNDVEPDYSHSTVVIIRSFDADPESVQKIIRCELQHECDAVRFNLCGAIKLIQCERPKIAENLLDDLIRSLDLYENTDGLPPPPSGQIVDILQLAFRYSTEKVDRSLAKSMARFRPAVQEDIVDVYRDQFSDRTAKWEKCTEQRNRTEVSKPEKAAIQRLLTWVKDDDIEIDIRAKALEALKTACDYAAAGVLNEFDSLLGYFAIVVGKERPPEKSPKILIPGQPQDSQLERLEEYSRMLRWNSFKQQLQECLGKLCPAKPSEIFDTVSRCLNQPWEQLENGFKSCCVSLLGEIGKDYLFQPRVLPLVWRALMDYGSASVRAEAIRATMAMFSHSSTAPPANMVDTIIVHLQDPKFVVQQAALDAVSWHPGWFDESQSIEVLTCLHAYLRAYRDEKYLLGNICNAILAVGLSEMRLKLLALRLIESVFPTGEKYIDLKIAKKLIRLFKPNERSAEFVAKDICACLARYERNHYNEYGNSEHHRMFEWLHQLPAATYRHVADDLLIAAREVAKRDHWESCCFASLFAHFRAFRYEQIVLETAASALPEKQSHEKLIAFLRQLAMIAAGNKSLQTGDTKMAKVYFAKGKDEA